MGVWDREREAQGRKNYKISLRWVTMGSFAAAPNGMIVGAMVGECDMSSISQSGYLSSSVFLSQIQARNPN